MLRESLRAGRPDFQIYFGSQVRDVFGGTLPSLSSKFAFELNTWSNTAILAPFLAQNPIWGPIYRVGFGDGDFPRPRFVPRKVLSAAVSPIFVQLPPAVESKIIPRVESVLRTLKDF